MRHPWRLGLLGLLLLGAGLRGGELRPYLGTLHDHTAEGGDDGQGSVAEALAQARSEGFAFIALTPHDHMIRPETYAALVRQVEAATLPGEFVPLAGFEWGVINKGGHVGVIGAQAMPDVGKADWGEFWAWASRAAEEPLVILNHPVWNRGFGGRPDGARDARAELVEVIGGPSRYAGRPGEAKSDFFHEDMLQLLNQGWRVGVAQGEDDHTGSWGRVSRARVGVWVEELTRQNLLAALKARRTFVTEDYSLTLWLEATDASGKTLPMGGEGAGERAAFLARAESPVEAITALAFYLDRDGPGGEPAREVQRSVGPEARLEVGDLAPGAYLFAVAQDESGDLAWSSPIWLGPAERWLDPPPRGSTGGSVDPNLSHRADLERLPGIGATVARQIMAARDKGAVFLSLDDLLVVPGLNAEVLSRLEKAGLRIGTPDEVVATLEDALARARELVMDDAERRYQRWRRYRAEEVVAAQLVALHRAGRGDEAAPLEARLAAIPASDGRVPVLARVKKALLEARGEAPSPR